MLRVDTPMHQAMIRRLVVDAGGARLVTAGDDKTIRIWQREAPTGEPQTLRLAQTLRVPMDSGHEGQLFALAMSPDGKRIAAGGWTCWDWERAGCVYVFDVESGAIVRRMRGLPDAVSALAWSADGRHLAIGLQGRAGVRVLRTDTFEEVAADRAYDDKVMETGLRQGRSACRRGAGWPASRVPQRPSPARANQLEWRRQVWRRLRFQRGLPAALPWGFSGHAGACGCRRGQPRAAGLVAY